MCALTDVTEYEVAEATREQTISGDTDVTDEVSANYWAEKGERLYVNGWIGKLDKYEMYVDLETGLAHCGNDAWEDKLSADFSDFADSGEIHIVCDESEAAGPSEKVHELTIVAEDE